MNEMEMEMLAAQTRAAENIRGRYAAKFPEHAADFRRAEDRQMKALQMMQRVFLEERDEGIEAAARWLSANLATVAKELKEQRRLFSRFVEGDVGIAPGPSTPAGPPRRSDGEVTRMREHLVRHRGLVDMLEYDLTDRHPPGVYNAQAVLESAGTIVVTAAKLDAYRRAEQEP